MIAGREADYGWMHIDCIQPFLLDETRR